MPVKPPTFHPLHGLKRGKQIERPTAAKRGYNHQWQRLRLAYLQQHPLCVRCKLTKRVTLATVVDHVTPHRGDHSLMWNPLNWQALCKACHDRKTAREDGGFGRRKRD